MRVNILEDKVLNMKLKYKYLYLNELRHVLLQIYAILVYNLLAKKMTNIRFINNIDTPTNLHLEASPGEQT